jgi:hypothetical protein
MKNKYKFFHFHSMCTGRISLSLELLFHLGSYLLRQFMVFMVRFELLTLLCVLVVFWTPQKQHRQKFRPFLRYWFLVKTLILTVFIGQSFPHFFFLSFGLGIINFNEFLWDSIQPAVAILLYIYKILIPNQNTHKICLGAVTLHLLIF